MALASSGLSETLPRSVRVIVSERLPFIFAHAVQPSITWKNRTRIQGDWNFFLFFFLCCCYSGTECLTHSASPSLWWNLQIRRCDPMTLEWRSAKTGPRDPAGERSYHKGRREGGSEDKKNTKDRKTQCWVALRTAGTACSSHILILMILQKLTFHAIPTCPGQCSTGHLICSSVKQRRGHLN